MTAQTSAIFQVIGLSLDILGVIMLFKFGLPEFSPMGGANVVVAGGEDPGEIEKEKRYRRMSKVALLCLVVGFGFQAFPSIVSLFKW